MPRLFSFCLLSACVAVGMHAATLTNTITVNTSAISGTSGYLDLLFNAGVPVTPATATISGFTSNGVLNGATSTSGTATGTLPGPVSIANNNAELLESFKFGSTFQFALTLTGTGPSSFTLSLLNSTLDGSFLTSDVNDGYLLRYDISSNGVITPTTFKTDTGAPSVVTIATATPEPAVFWLAGTGLSVLGFLRKRKLVHETQP